MTEASEPAQARLIEECRRRAIALLLDNLGEGGIRCSKAHAQGDGARLRRDLRARCPLCALGMALSGDPRLEAEAATGLLTLAEHQAANGQIPKFVDSRPHAAGLSARPAPVRSLLQCDPILYAILSLFQCDAS